MIMLRRHYFKGDMCNKGLYLVYRHTVVTWDDLLWYWRVIRIAYRQVTHTYICYGASYSGASQPLQMSQCVHCSYDFQWFSHVVRLVEILQRQISVSLLLII